MDGPAPTGILATLMGVHGLLKKNKIKLQGREVRADWEELEKSRGQYDQIQCVKFSLIKCAQRTKAYITQACESK